MKLNKTTKKFFAAVIAGMMVIAALAGTALAAPILRDDAAPAPTENPAPAAPAVTLEYTTHVQAIGWQTPVTGGNIAGTTGQGLRMEAIKINLKNSPYSGGIRYQAHIQNIGWQDWVSDGALCGTTGQYLRLEAIKVQLYGEIASHYDIYYRVHSQTFGWLGWANNGESAGTAGMAKRVEAVQIVIAEKGQGPTDTQEPFYENSVLSYMTHVQQIGWMDAVSSGMTAGTSGQSLRMEALCVALAGQDYSGGIRYQAHVQNEGWQTWVANGDIAGTTGQGLRMEAIRIKLTGEMARHYDVLYRVHVQNIGWQDWVYNGDIAGTTGQALRVEAIEIKLAPRTSAPDMDVNAYFSDAVFIGNSTSIGLDWYFDSMPAGYMGDPAVIAHGSYSFNTDKYRQKGYMLTLNGVEYQAKDIIRLGGFSKAFINMGTNDISAVTAEVARDRYIEYLQGIAAVNPDVTLFVTSMTPKYNTSRAPGINNTKIDAFNRYMDAYCSTQPNMFYIDFAYKLKAADGSLAPQYCSDQYVHITPAGYEIWVETVKEEVINLWYQGELY